MNNDYELLECIENVLRIDEVGAAERHIKLLDRGAHLAYGSFIFAVMSDYEETTRMIADEFLRFERQKSQTIGSFLIDACSIGYLGYANGQDGILVRGVGLWLDNRDEMPYNEA